MQSYNKRKHALALVAGTPKTLRFFGRPCCGRYAHMKKVFVILMATLSFQAFAWECNAPKGVLVREGVFEIKKDGLDVSHIDIYVSAPEEIEGRQFDGTFVLWVKNDKDWKLATFIPSIKLGNRYTAHFAGQTSFLKSVVLEAGYHDKEFKYGCHIEARHKF